MKLVIGSWLLVVGLSAVAACGDDAAVTCHVGADCASGACSAGGQCVPVAGGGDAGGSDAGAVGSDAASSTDAGSDDARVAGDSGACVANEDGIITRAEVPLGAGLHATFRTAQDVTVDTAGATQAGGKRKWDYSGALSGDHGLLLETVAVNGQWFASDFSGASYVARLSDTSDLLGVFELSPTALLLRGVVSPSSGTSQTNVSDDPSVPSLKFPLQKGTTWEVTANVSGTASGYPVAYTEKYVSEVDAEGDLVTPLATFPVLRVKVTLTRTVGLLQTTVRSFAFVTECYGVVARVVSKDNETKAEFTQAAEIQRISP